MYFLTKATSFSILSGVPACFPVRSLEKWQKNLPYKWQYVYLYYSDFCPYLIVIYYQKDKNLNMQVHAEYADFVLFKNKSSEI